MKTENVNGAHSVSGGDMPASPGMGAEDPEACALVVQAVEDLIGGYSREFILCVLLTVTVNAIHVIEDRATRRRTEERYIKALGFLSAVEEQFQPEDDTGPPDWADACLAKMMRHVFRGIGLGVELDD